MTRTLPKFGQLLAATVIAGFVVQPVMAAPYCLSTEIIPPQCHYFDPVQCQHDAQQQNGQCTANPQETRLTMGYGKYCVVTAGGASNCNYTDQGSCSRDAVRQNGACTPSNNVAPLQGVNPYSAQGGD